MSAWADAAGRYRTERELRTTQGLKSRFIVQFEGGTLLLMLPNGATRRIDSGEFASAWTLLETGAAAAAIRMVTANGNYLDAIRRDLLGAGLGVSGGSDDDVDLGTTAAALVSEAITRTGSSAMASERERPSTAEAVGVLEVVAAERDELVRELARQKAAVTVVEERLAAEEEKSRQLEAALAAKPKPAAEASGLTGAKQDPVNGFTKYVEAELGSAKGLSARVRSGIKEALEVALGHPELAVVQCRKVAEAIAETLYLTITGASEVPPYSRATDWLEDVRDRPGVDMVIWNLHRNIFRLSNSYAHVLKDGSRQFALTLVAMVLIVASHVPTDDTEQG